jgi:WD40 repeat protein
MKISRVNQVSLLGDVTVLAFSADGKFLAGGGQGGWLWIWAVDQDFNVQLLEQFKFRTPWIDRLAWHPHRPLLAIATGKTIQLWHGETKKFKGVLNFEASSVLDLAWDAMGDRLAASGNLAIKIWRTDRWDDAPTVLALDSASSAIAWSPDGQYFAVGTFDRTVRVMACTAEISIDEAWVMRGFPAKISAVAWSPGPINHPSQPTLAVVSSEGVLLWDWADDEAIGWVGQVALEHSDPIGSIAWNALGLAIVAPKLFVLWRSGALESVSERDWFAIHWHPRLPILVGINDDSQISIEVWRFEE